MQLIATRRYFIADPEGRDHKATDTLYRLDSGEYELDMRTDGLPGEADRVERVEPEYAFQWLTEIPEQIEYSSARSRGGRALVLLT